MARFDLGSIFSRGTRNAGSNAQAGLGNVGRRVSDADLQKAAKQDPIISKAVGVDNIEDARTAVNGKTLNGKTVDELAVDAKVKEAEVSQASKLAKLGIKGAAGIAILMILTGESNPITAIDNAVSKTSDTAQGVLGAFGGLLDFFTTYGTTISLSCSCCICIILLILIGSSVKKAMGGMGGNGLRSF